ncbi:MAG: periplasmic heavy metal sensor [Hyphomicrobiaceae bacterium]
MTQDAGDTQPRKHRNWLLVGFLVSLMLNMLLIGVMVGGKMRHWPGGWGGHRDGGPAAFMRGIPDERRKVLRESFEAGRKELREHRQIIQRLRQDARETMSKEPFDRAAARAALAQVGAARSDFHARASERFVEFLSGLSPEERRIFLSRHGKRKKHDRTRDDGEDAL